MKVQILNGEVLTRTTQGGNGKASFTFRTQKAAVMRENDFPLPFAITLRDDQQAYAKGEYDLCASSLVSGEFDGLAFGRNMKLVTPSPSPGKA